MEGNFFNLIQKEEGTQKGGGEGFPQKKKEVGQPWWKLWIQSALWSHESEMLFTPAMTYKAECKTFLTVSDLRDNRKDTATVFIDFLYNHFGVTEAIEDIWSDRPTSKFKNKFMVKFLQPLSQKYNQQFSWKYFATSHGKGIVDGIGRRAKSLVCSKVMSRSMSSSIVM